MKLRWKIFSVLVVTYALGLILIAVLVTESTYRQSVQSEIERGLRDQQNIYSSMTIYLHSSRLIAAEQFRITDYGLPIVEMFSGKGIYLGIFNSRKKLIHASPGCGLVRKWDNRALIPTRTYILRYSGKRYFMLIFDSLAEKQQTMFWVLARDISYLDEQRRQSYLQFVKLGIFGLFLLGIAGIYISRWLTSPISKLGSAAQRIASGEYSERVNISGHDELSELAGHFNIMAAEIEKKIDELHQENKRKQVFVDNLGHELRTPLTAIIGYSDILRQIKYDQDRMASGLTFIHNEGQRMLRMADTLMQLANLRGSVLQMESIQSGQLLEEAVQVLSFKAAKQRVKLRVAEGIQMDFLGNGDLLKEVLINLGDNAIQASPDGGEVVLGTSDQDVVWSFYVQDQGSGMNVEQLQHITEPFYRADKSRSRHLGGAGLGLPLCAEIARLHNGELHFTSRPGEGTLAEIRFKK